MTPLSMLAKSAGLPILTATDLTVQLVKMDEWMMAQSTAPESNATSRFGLKNLDNGNDWEWIAILPHFASRRWPCRRSNGRFVAGQVHSRSQLAQTHLDNGGLPSVGARRIGGVPWSSLWACRRYFFFMCALPCRTRVRLDLRLE